MVMAICAALGVSGAQPHCGEPRWVATSVVIMFSYWRKAATLDHQSIALST
ncbi:hypothetical protein BN973_04009 [Mycobacterium triplex]|uniref:Uncharacterized protein n=1 Tax=Mycobacterium triplex TaxID=47839 RepID=A0A024K1E0_9MYCO|nr:hypothetical protein BN973_04009 [Mycobacterium triplex]